MPRNLPAFFFAFALFGQVPPVVPQSPGTPDVQLPNGKSQHDEILKLDHKKNLEDAAAMAKLAEEVSEDLEKNDRYVMSLKMLKQLDDIEKLAKTIRGRIKKY
jgi:ABC-type Zn2+ transport system substrate-binding protein/surface adhesin